MSPKKTPSTSDPESAPFGAGAVEASSRPTKAPDAPASGNGRAENGSNEGAAATSRGGRRRQGRGRRGRRSGEDADARPSEQEAEKPRESQDGEPREEARAEGAEGAARQGSRKRRWQDRRKRKRRPRSKDGREDGRGQGSATGSKAPAPGGGGRPAAGGSVDGMLVLEKGNHGHVRKRENDYLAQKSDAHVPPRLVQKLDLREGARIEGTVRRGQGRHKWEVATIDRVDGLAPDEARKAPRFKQLTSIDPDFHYAVGDSSQEVSLKVLDLICPVGRGQRGLIVAPPRSGKTILLQQFAKAVETTFPEVHLVVLLVDERPEEATEWKRSVNGDVFVSTNDESHKRHVQLAEAVWARCCRMVEMGEDVILLLDSITRLGRAYNNVHGNSGKTMSGGIDTRALERPKQFFGAARNTETAGSLTILGTTLIETGSRMDQVIFEEFKGTGNMELVLSRKLADRRIFPAIDLVKSGTRKEEKLFSSRRLNRVTTLRRVLGRMHFAEAMELLITKLMEVEKVDDFLQRFEVDPEE